MTPVLLLLGAALAAPPAQFAAPTDVPVLSDDGTGVRAVVAAQRVTFTEAYRPAWRAEAEPVDSGWLVVLSVDPVLARQRQTWTPVLYAGATPVERLYMSADATCVVGLVTGPAKVPFYFGSTQLPERVTPERGAAELAAAQAAGIGTPALPEPGAALTLDADRLVATAEQTSSACR